MNGWAIYASKTAAMFAGELAMERPLDKLWDSLALNSKGAAGVVLLYLRGDDA